MKLPLVSIILVSKRLNKLKLCIKHLLSQSYRSFEIIIIWNGSINELKELESYIISHINIRIIEDGSNNVSRGRNIGIKNAKGKLVAFTDDDCIADRNWLIYLINCLQKDKIIAGAGSIRNVENKNSYFASLWQLAYIKIGDMNIKYNFMNSENLYLCTSSALFKKQIILSVGGFDERLISGEDLDISNRIKAAGYHLKLEPKAILTHFHPETLKGLIKQQIWYGCGSYQMSKKYRRNILIDNIRIIIEIFGIYKNSLLYSIKSKDLKLLIIFPFYIITLYSSRYLGYLSAMLRINNF